MIQKEGRRAKVLADRRSCACHSWGTETVRAIAAHKRTYLMARVLEFVLVRGCFLAFSVALIG